jgi:hypothetical protein
MAVLALLPTRLQLVAVDSHLRILGRDRPQRRRLGPGGALEDLDVEDVEWESRRRWSRC